MRTILLLIALLTALLISSCKSCTKKSKKQKEQEKEQLIYEQPEKKINESTEPLKEKQKEPVKNIVKTKTDTQETNYSPEEPEQTDEPESIRIALKAKYRQINVGPYARFYMQKYPGGKSILWVSSLDRVSKIDVTGNEFKLINQLPIVGSHYFSDEEIENLNKAIKNTNSINEILQLRDNVFEKYKIQQPASSLMHKNGYLYIAYGQRIYAFGDEQERFAASAAEMKLSYKIPKKSLKSDDEHIVAFAESPSKKFVFVTNKGTMGLIGNNLRKPVYANIPENELYSYEMAFDNSNGIYLTSDKAVYRFVEEQNGIITTGNKSFRLEHGESPGAVPGAPILVDSKEGKTIVFIAGNKERKLIVIGIDTEQNRNSILSKTSLGESLTTEKYKKNYHVNNNSIIVFNNRLINNNIVGHIECYKLNTSRGSITKQWTITKENIFSFPALLNNKKIMAATMEDKSWNFEFIDFNNGALLEYIPIEKRNNLLPVSPQLLISSTKRMFYISPLRLTEIKIEN
jgi:hypothetical protein